jgi:hypothetical protein
LQYYEAQGEHYSGLFPAGRETLRAKILKGYGVRSWWLRTALNNTSFADVKADGRVQYGASATSYGGIVFGFTIGHHLTEEEKWTALKTAISNGTLKTDYAIGDTLPLNLGTEGKVEMQIAAFDEAGSHVSFVSKGLLTTLHRMNPATNGTQGTGANGGWEYSEMRTYLEETILPLVPSYVSSAIVPVTKYSDYIAPGSSSVTHDQTTTDKLWIPSAREVFGGSYYEQTGPVYTSLFTDNSSRIKYNQSGSAYYWWLRSAYSANYFNAVYTGGGMGNNNANSTMGVALGFSL